MIHESTIPAGKKVADVDVQKALTKDESKSAMGVDAMIEEIHQRADNIGSVLEEILQIGHQAVKGAAGMVAGAKLVSH